MRGLAAIAVMFAHLQGVEARQADSGGILPPDMMSGVSGVDLFFVISGFIMVWIAGETDTGVRQSGKFLFARVMRIYPLWWLFAGVMAGYFFYAYGVPWYVEVVTLLGVDGPEHLIKSFLLIPHDALPILPVGWTLVHEMYFYIVFAGVLMLPVSWRGPACALWASIILASISAQLTGLHATSILNLILFPMTLQFLMGAAIAWIIKGGWTQFAWPALFTGLIWLIVAAVTIDFSKGGDLQPVWRTFGYGPAFALLIYAAITLETRAKSGSFTPDALVRLGDWSYSLYLCHLLVLSAVGRLFFDAFDQDGVIDNIVFLIIAPIACVAVAAATFYAFEKPVVSLSRNWREKLFRSKPD